MRLGPDAGRGRLLGIGGLIDGRRRGRWTTSALAIDKTLTGNGKMVEEIEGRVRRSTLGMRIERRSGIDRRRQGRHQLRFLLSGGRRTQGRRYEDRQRVNCFDRYRQSHFGLIVLILFFSVMDALLTLELIHRGAVELNPIMAYYLEFDPRIFLLVKYGLTSAGVLILLLFNGFVLRTLRIRVATLLYLVLAAFLGVFSWQVYLIHTGVV